MLRTKFPDLTEDGRLHVYAFAPPPVLDHDSAIAAAPFVTSFVHNADLIPRCSLFNLAILLQGLRRIHEILKERGLNPTGPQTSTAFVRHLFSSTKEDIGTIEDEILDDCGDDNDRGAGETTLLGSKSEPAVSSVSSTFNTEPRPNTPLLTLEEWRDAIEEGVPEIRKREHLFVAGRVFLIYSPWREEDVTDCEQPTNSVARVATRPLRCVETDGASPALRMIEADGPRLFTDHCTSSYFEALGMEYHFE